MNAGLETSTTKIPKRTWIFVAEDSAVEEGALLAVYPLGVNTVLARVDGTLYAVSGACTHMGCPMFRGTLVGCTITCPCHDWRYDIRTGKMLDAPELGLNSYPVEVRGGKIFISMA